MLLIVVPCFNEEHRLPVAEFERYVAEDPRPRFLFVNDGSSDGTAPMLDALAARHPQRFSVLHLPRNAGKAEAVRQGFLRAFSDGATLVGFWDADLATPLDEIPRFLQVLDADKQVMMVFGARIRLLGRNIRRNILRHYVGRAFATVASNYLRLEIYDTQCGAKIFRNVPAVRAVFARPWISRWLFDVEILARWTRQHPRAASLPDWGICEVPLQRWEDVKGSKVKGRDFLKAFGELARIMAKYR